MRRLEAFAILFGTVALMGCAETAVLSKAGECASPDNETYVAGGSYCLAIQTVRSKSNFDGPVTLVVTLHGDNGPELWEGITERTPNRRPEFKDTNTVIVNIIRPGYSYAKRKSSGFVPTMRRTTYTPEVISAVLEAITALGKHHNASTIPALGNSGGAAILASAVGKFPEKVPEALDEIALFSCPCDIPTWEAYNGWPTTTDSVSPLEVADKTPRRLKVRAITAKDDNNTRVELSERYIAKLQEHGVRTQLMAPEHGGHGGVVFASQAAMDIVRVAINLKPQQPVFMFAPQ